MITKRRLLRDPAVPLSEHLRWFCAVCVDLDAFVREQEPHHLVVTGLRRDVHFPLTPSPMLNERGLATRS
jgi:hypothetical protein